jgi:hypothetical protein
MKLFFVRHVVHAFISTFCEKRFLANIHEGEIIGIPDILKVTLVVL